MNMIDLPTYTYLIYIVIKFIYLGIQIYLNKFLYKMDPSNKCGDADKLVCCFCNKPTSGAHRCRKCSRPCHAIPPCSLSSDGEEGYGSKVICGGCDLIGDSDIDENANAVSSAQSTSKATTEDMVFSQLSRKRRGFTIKEKLDIIEHAKKTSIHAASRHFKVSRDNIRCWKKEEANLRKMTESCKRKRLSGAGRKLTDANFDDALANWVRELRQKKLRVTRTMVFSRAQQTSPNYKNLENFSASHGWLESFMSRHSFSLRKPTTLAQKPPDNYAQAIVNFIVYVQKLWHEKNYSGVFACDETAVCLDPTGGNCVSEKGAKSVTVLTTGHEKARVTVMLTARSDGTKLRPFVLLHKKRPVPDIAKRFKNDLVLCWCGRTWMDNELTTKFLEEVLGNFAFGRRLLIWDSFRCHISDDTKQTLRRLSIESAVIPGGTTKYIQPPDVCWNAPFKNKIRQIYDECRSPVPGPVNLTGLKRA